MARRKSLSAIRPPNTSTGKRDDPKPGPEAEPASGETGAISGRPHEAADSVENEYRSPEPPESEIRDRIATCFLLETAPENITLRSAGAAVTASRIEAMCVPQGWRALPPDPDTNRDEIPIVLKLREIFRLHGHDSVDELWFLRVEHTLASALDALDRSRAADDVLTDLIMSDIGALEEEIRHQRTLCGALISY
jgi:hypothetical protein